MLSSAATSDHDHDIARLSHPLLYIITPNNMDLTANITPVALKPTADQLYV
jgi:hypothetical protein